MRRLIVMTSLIVLGLSGSALAQANMGMDSSGRFDGSPPLGTVPDDQQTGGGLSIPIDSFTTESTGNPNDIQWTRCQKRTAGDVSTRQACIDNQ